GAAPSTSLRQSLQPAAAIDARHHDARGIRNSRGKATVAARLQDFYLALTGSVSMSRSGSILVSAKAGVRRLRKTAQTCPAGRTSLVKHPASGATMSARDCARTYLNIPSITHAQTSASCSALGRLVQAAEIENATDATRPIS